MIKPTSTKTILGIALVAACAEASLMRDAGHFMTYAAQFGKDFKTEEEFQMRMANFIRTDDVIRRHNAKVGTSILGHNKFSDWTPEEKQAHLGEKNAPQDLDVPLMKATKTDSQLPDFVNWCDVGACTPVKDQGQCGSCWTFAAAESVESALWISKLGKEAIQTFSEQQLVDCVNFGDNHGCDGGWTYDAFTYYETSAAMHEADYPYTAQTGLRCKYDAAEGVVNLSSHVFVDKNPTAMRQAVSNMPMAVSIRASSDVFHQYTSGVISGPECGTDTNHAVVTVGYGHDSASGLDYWLVRNSWGEDWGDNGFVKIAIEDGLGVCGINIRPLYPIVA